jgi:hypothetical protein
MELSILKRSSRAREKDRAIVLQIVSLWRPELQLQGLQVNKTYDCGRLLLGFQSRSSSSSDIARSYEGEDKTGTKVFKLSGCREERDMQARNREQAQESYGGGVVLVDADLACRS